MLPLHRGLPVLVFVLPLAGCISEDSTVPPSACASVCVDASVPAAHDAGEPGARDATVGDGAATDAQSDAASGFDAGAAGDAATADGGASDGGAADDAGSDAATSDGGAADDAGSDAATSDAGAPDAAPAIQECVVDLTGGTNTFLISDPGAGHIDQVTMTGTVLHTYTAPMSNVAGVAFDRRARDGFWVVGRDTGAAIAKIAWSGAALPTLTTSPRSYTNLRGLDYCLGTTAANDFLVMVGTNSNSLDVGAGAHAATGASEFEMGFSAPGGFQSGYWGVSFLAADSAANVLRGWFARASSLELWQTASPQDAVTMGVSDPRGLVRAPNGDFWVVDATAHKVVHLSPNGTVLGGFDTPGTQPAGLSFDPGP